MVGRDFKILLNKKMKNRRKICIIYIYNRIDVYLKEYILSY